MYRFIYGLTYFLYKVKTSLQGTMWYPKEPSMKDSQSPKRVGLLFGSFNPVHLGHMLLAEAVLENAFADEVWFIVSPHNPHKDRKELAPFENRLEMVRIAIGDRERVQVSDIEKDLPLPSYTFMTLRKLREVYLDTTFSLIIGSDVLHALSTWREPEEICTHHDFLVRGRRDEEIKIPDDVRAKIIPGVHEISATSLRDMLRSGKETAELDPRVRAYIDSYNLYR